MKSIDNVMPIPVVIASYLRPHFIERLIPLYDKRTYYPHRIIVAHGSPENGENEDQDRQCINLLKRFKVEGVVDEVLYAKADWDRPNPGQGGLQDMALKWVYENMPTTPYIVFSQSDLEPPDMRPCWLENMVHLMDKYRGDYAAIAARIEVTPRLSWNEGEDDIIDSRKSIPSVGRIMPLDDIRAMGDRPFGQRLHWESLVAAGQIEKIHKKQAFATRVFFAHRGYQPNKGYGEDVSEYHTMAPNKANLYEEKPYPETDPKTHEPIYNQDYKFHKDEFDRRKKFWDVHIGVQDPTMSEKPRRKAARAYGAAVFEGVDGTVYDMGCGDTKFRDSAVGVDMWPYDNVSLVGDVFDPWFIESGSGEGIYASHILEHAKRPVKDVLKAWDRILKPGGKLVIVVPDAENRPSTIMEPSHNYAFTKEVLGQLVGKFLGYRIISLDNLEGCPENKKDIAVTAQKG